jgi:CHAT domain-containing protein
MPRVRAESDEKPLALAEAAHTLVQADAVRAAELAGRALGLARARSDREAEVAALHALGFARAELGDARAVRTLRAAVRIADRHGLARRAALARRPLAIYLADTGAIGAALREIDTACAWPDEHERARAEVARIAVLGIAGRAPASLSASNRALLTLRREGDLLWEARLLKNRGLLLAERGDAGAAEPDLTRARDLYAGLGATEAALAAEIALARLALARGDLPICLARLDAIDRAGVSPNQNAWLQLLRAQALIAGRLMGEARHALADAQAVWQRAGADDPEARLEVIRLTLHAGEPAQAQVIADRARRSFAAGRRPVYCARAVGLWVAAAIAAKAVPPSAIRSGRRAAATLAAAGWRDEALRVRLLVARGAVELGALAVARRELADCAPLRRRGSVADRVDAWHVEALLRRSSGDDTGAQRAARSALRLLDSYRAALGASDLRAGASSIGVELAQLGLRIALAGDDPRQVLEWAEMLRASALRLAPVTPPDSTELRDRATDLRRLTVELRRAERVGRSDRALMAHQAALEASIRRLSRHVTGNGVSATGIASTKQIAQALGSAALVELVALDGTLTALTVVGPRLARHDLGSVAAVQEELGWLRFSLARITRRGQSSAQRAAARAGAQASAQSLDHRLIAPLARVLGQRGLVIVPTGSLHHLPWPMLPSLRGRPLVVAPSAAAWVDRQVSPRPRRRKIVLVAGPRLRHACNEVAGVRDLYASPIVLTGNQATVGAVMGALDGATVAHLACHGHFRSDSPLFSSLELADGPLNVYELQRLSRPPDLIVLSACDLAISDPRPGDELLGFAAALIGMGARTVIASVVPVPDAAARRLMIALHGDLTAGLSPAVALARAQQALRASESALAGFVCLGTAPTSFGAV